MEFLKHFHILKVATSKSTISFEIYFLLIPFYLLMRRKMRETGIFFFEWKSNILFTYIFLYCFTIFVFATEIYISRGLCFVSWTLSYANVENLGYNPLMLFSKLSWGERNVERNEKQIENFIIFRRKERKCEVFTILYLFLYKYLLVIIF